MYRQAIARQARLFSTTPLVRKSALDSAKEAAKTVDKNVSQAAVGAIETGEHVAQKAKEAAGLSASDAKAQANEAAGEIKGKASEVSGKAKGAAAEAKGKFQ